MRLSHWLALVFAVFGALTAGAVAVRHVHVAGREAYASTARLSAVTLEAIRSLVQAQARDGSFLALGRNFEDLVRQAGVATIVVRDRAGKRLLGRSDDLKLLARVPTPGRSIDQVDDGVYDLETAVHLGRRGRGTLQVGFHTSWLEARLRGIAAEAFGLGVGSFAALALFGWFVGLFTGERVERMVARIETLAADPARFRPLRAEDGIGGAELARLVSAFNRMGQSLKLETARRRELEAEKRELSAMLVHDLKTPLTVIRSGITLLADVMPARVGKRDNTRTFELLELSTARLQRMVEDVLNLAKLEESATLQNLELVDLKPLAEACARDFALVVKGRKQSLELKTWDFPIPPVMGDPALLRRVLDNLVHNAVEHTPAGGVITIAVRPEGPQIVVEVSDSGPGVPPEARGDIFRKFFQKDVKRHVGNVGLGLALCEKVVTRHGGMIGIGDAIPTGARFYFTLPHAPTPSELS